MPIHAAALWSAYLATTYVAVVDGVELGLRVGEHAAGLDAVLDAAGVTSWCFVTAFNPDSDLLDDAANRARDAELLRWIEERGLVAYPGEGRGDDGAWPPEPSHLVLGLAKREAIALGARFGQRAIVRGDRGGCAELVGCRAANEARD